MYSIDGRSRGDKAIILKNQSCSKIIKEIKKLKEKA